MSFKTENARAKAEEIKQLKDLFSLYDNDNSGSINKTELKLLMNSLGYYPSDEMIQQMILENDVDGDELIDFEEFVQMAQKYKKEEAINPSNALRNALQWVSFPLLVHYFYNFYSEYLIKITRVL